MPSSQKEVIRRSIACSGAGCRITDDPFVYLDKNHVRMLGGIRGCLTAVSGLKGYLKVIQLKLHKTELRIERIELQGANLNDIAGSRV